MTNSIVKITGEVADKFHDLAQRLAGRDNLSEVGQAIIKEAAHLLNVAEDLAEWLLNGGFIHPKEKFDTGDKDAAGNPIKRELHVPTHTLTTDASGATVLTFDPDQFAAAKAPATAPAPEPATEPAAAPASAA
jgi:hypothetical protein